MEIKGGVISGTGGGGVVFVIDAVPLLNAQLNLAAKEARNRQPGGGGSPDLGRLPDEAAIRIAELEALLREYMSYVHDEADLPPDLAVRAATALAESRVK